MTQNINYSLVSREHFKFTLQVLNEYISLSFQSSRQSMSFLNSKPILIWTWIIDCPRELLTSSKFSKRSFPNVMIIMHHRKLVFLYESIYAMAIEKFLYLSSLGWLLQEYNFWMGRGFQVWKFHLKISPWEEKPCLPRAYGPWEASFSSRGLIFGGEEISMPETQPIRKFYILICIIIREYKRREKRLK